VSQELLTKGKTLANELGVVLDQDTINEARQAPIRQSKEFGNGCKVTASGDLICPSNKYPNLHVVLVELKCQILCILCRNDKQVYNSYFISYNISTTISGFVEVFTF